MEEDLFNFIRSKITLLNIYPLKFLKNVKNYLKRFKKLEKILFVVKKDLNDIIKVILQWS